MKSTNTVIAVEEPLEIPTYPLGLAEKYPLFFEKRVYQGSSGKVYPVPFIDKVTDTPQPVVYRSVRLENECIRLVLLPEIGGRIFIAQDKTNEDYDFFYRQEVIKPALVGLAGPWISGGVEFNWPQHHRPGTYLPTDFYIEEEADGACTVWMSEHDPIQRLKGMHGIRLRPGSSRVELRARLYNRTPLTHTFLWWANVAARVHDQYQSFFPEDVHYVADHAVRAMSSFPVAENEYYGVDYAKRPGANDLSWYANIPVPTSYMVCDTKFDFFGGYDHAAGGGFVHVADRHIAPGKKQWTWGNHAFGHAWDRELTDPTADGEYPPYIELMAGVFTDNQPDFTYLRPGEVKTFSQFWWPYRELGPLQQVDERLGIRLVVDASGAIDAGVVASEAVHGLRVRLWEGERLLVEATTDLAPGRVWRAGSLQLTGDSPAALRMALFSPQENCLLEYSPVEVDTRRKRELATEPPKPEAAQTNDELYWIGEHLEQYRHPTRAPDAYWSAALERDPQNQRAHLALGRQLLQRGQFLQAAKHLQAAVARATARHPNPESGEAHYFLGLALSFQGQDTPAREAFAKAAWDGAWCGAAQAELAALALRAGANEAALVAAEAALDRNRRSNRANILAAIAQRRMGRTAAASEFLDAILLQDPLDFWARWERCLHGDDRDAFFHDCRNDAQTVLDLVFDYVDCGEFSVAAELLEAHHARGTVAVAVPNPMERNVMTRYVAAWLASRLGDEATARRLLQTASEERPIICFPHACMNRRFWSGRSRRLPTAGRLLDWAIFTTTGSVTKKPWSYGRGRSSCALITRWPGVIWGLPAGICGATPRVPGKLTNERSKQHPKMPASSPNTPNFGANAARRPKRGSPFSKPARRSLASATMPRSNGPACSTTPGRPGARWTSLKGVASTPGKGARAKSCGSSPAPVSCSAKRLWTPAMRPEPWPILTKHSIPRPISARLTTSCRPKRTSTIGAVVPFANSGGSPLRLSHSGQLRKRRAIFNKWRSPSIPSSRSTGRLPWMRLARRRRRGSFWTRCAHLPRGKKRLRPRSTTSPPPCPTCWSSRMIWRRSKTRQRIA